MWPHNYQAVVFSMHYLMYRQDNGPTSICLFFTPSITAYRSIRITFAYISMLNPLAYLDESSFIAVKTDLIQSFKVLTVQMASA